MVRIRPLGRDDAAILRTVRLRSLADAPGVFTSTYAREQAFDAETWRDRLRTCQWFLAEDEARERREPGAGAGSDGGDPSAAPPVGIVGGLPGWSDDPTVRQLVAMWVAPDHRRTGVAGALLGAVAGWARDGGAERLVLEVLLANEGARSFYRRAGLTPTGLGHHALPSGGTAAVETYELALDRPAPGDPDGHGRHGPPP